MCFYDTYDVICEKKVNKCVDRISSFCEHYGFLKGNTKWKPVPPCRVTIDLPM